MPTTHARTSSKYTSRTRPAAHAAARPLARLDTSTFDPTGADLLRFDPLASPDASYERAIPSPSDPGTLTEVADRSSVQMAVLRRTLESAIRLERSVTDKSIELGHRLEQGATFTREMDRRLIAAGSAVGVLDRATALLKSLDAIVTQLRSAESAHQEWINGRLDAQKQAFERSLAEMQVRFEQRTAEVERSAAAASARVSVLLDDGQQRLAELEAESTRIGAAARERVERACDAAAAVLGHDPRTGDGSRPASGSLADAVARAESATEHAADASLRLSALADRASQSEAKLTQSLDQARMFDESQAAFREAIVRQSDSETRLAALRDDLESVAASARYNLSQAQQAEASLLRAEQQAAARIDRLDRAMHDATEQARGLVHVARDVGGLVQHAEQVRRTLESDLTPQAARSAPKRSALAAPRPREEGDASASVAA